MICPNCSAVCEDTDIKCPSCGTLLPAAAPLDLDMPTSPPSPAAKTPRKSAKRGKWPFSKQEPKAAKAPSSADGKPAKPRRKWPFVLIGLAVLAVLLVTAVLLAQLQGRSAPYIFLDESALYSIHSETTGAELVFQGTKQIASLNGQFATAYSLRGDAFLCLSDDGSTLYCVTEKGATKVSAGVAAFAFAADGEGAAFVTSGGDLYLYHVTNEAVKLLAADVSDKNLAISPDGKTVAYVGDTTPNSHTAYLSVDGKTPKEIDKLVLPISVSNGGKTLYYYQLDRIGDTIGSLYAAAGTKSLKLASGMDIAYGVSLNAAATELLYTSGGKTYLSQNGGKELLLFTEATTPVTPARMAKLTLSGGVEVLGLSTFMERAYLVSQSLERPEFYAGSANGVVIAGLADGVRSAAISADGKHMLFLKPNGRMYSFAISSYDSATQLGTGDTLLSRFIPNSDCTAFYGMADGGGLYYQKNKGELREIATDADTIFVSPDGAACLFRSGAAMHTSVRGGAKKPLVVTGTFLNVIPIGSGLGYYVNTDSGVELYYAATGVDFALVASNVSGACRSSAPATMAELISSQSTPRAPLIR